MRTASSEQVRKPIYREGLTTGATTSPGSVRLKDALGPVLEPYPAVPLISMPRATLKLSQYVQTLVVHSVQQAWGASLR